MKQILFAACVLAAVTLTACSSDEPANNTTPAAVDSVTAAPGTTTQPVGVGIGSDTSNVVVAPEAASSAKATGPLNPAHGQPGHTCAIPVGAPLSSAPAAGATPTAAPTITQTPGSNEVKLTTAPSASTPPAPVTLQTAPPQGAGAAAPKLGTGSGKLNPPHGQPGHDCAVPVGQPLPK